MRKGQSYRRLRCWEGLTSADSHSGHLLLWDLATFRRKIEGLNRVDSEVASGGSCMNVRTKHFRAELLWFLLTATSHRSILVLPDATARFTYLSVSHCGVAFSRWRDQHTNHSDTRWPFWFKSRCCSRGCKYRVRSRFHSRPRRSGAKCGVGSSSGARGPQSFSLLTTCNLHAMSERRDSPSETRQSAGPSTKRTIGIAFAGAIARISRSEPDV